MAQSSSLAQGSMECTYWSEQFYCGRRITAFHKVEFLVIVSWAFSLLRDPGILWTWFDCCYTFCCIFEQVHNYVTSWGKQIGSFSVVAKHHPFTVKTGVRFSQAVTPR